MQTFFKSQAYAVVGATNDASKFGNRVLKWYTSRNLPVTPVNPKGGSIEGLQAVKDLSDLKDPTNTSVSVITPPKVTLQILQTAKDIGIPTLWLQPGCENEEVDTFIRDNGLSSKVIYGGPCILVIGDNLLSNAKL